MLFRLLQLVFCSILQRYLIATITTDFINNIAYLERIFETLDEPVTVDDEPGAGELPKIKGKVTFDDES